MPVHLRDDVLARHSRRQNVEHRLRANARHQDDEVDFAGCEPFPEVEDRLVLLERGLAHRRRDRRLASLAEDQ
jgi:hypothetical protein